MKKEIQERLINGKIHTIYPEKEKRRIVKEIVEGLLSVKEAQEKYSIHRTGTIQGWLKQYSEEYRTKYMRVIYTDAQRRTVVREVESGHLSILVACEKYRITKDTLKDWLKAYSCLSNNDTIMQENNVKNTSQTPVSTSKNKELEALKLKIAGLEAMIDIAEQEFKIDIRKKSGTKQ